MNKGNSSTRTIVATGLGAALFLVLFMLGCLLMLILIIYVRVAVNHSIYYNPFIH